MKKSWRWAYINTLMPENANLKCTIPIHKEAQSPRLSFVYVAAKGRDSNVLPLSNLVFWYSHGLWHCSVSPSLKAFLTFRIRPIVVPKKLPIHNLLIGPVVESVHENTIFKHFYWMLVKIVFSLTFNKNVSSKKILKAFHI